MIRKGKGTARERPVRILSGIVVSTAIVVRVNVLRISFEKTRRTCTIRKTETTDASLARFISSLSELSESQETHEEGRERMGLLLPLFLQGQAREY